METVNLAKLSLDLKKISHWSPDRKRRFIMITAILRDLIVFHKLLMCVAGRDDKHEAVRAGDDTMRLTFSTLLIG